MKIPAILTAGDSATWEDLPTSDNLGNAIDSSWTLKYALKQSAIAVTLTASTHGSGWSTAITKVQSATFAAGIVFWQAYAEKVLQRITLGSGQITVKVNVADATGTFDGRTQIQQDLDAVELAIRTMISGGAVAEYSIGGRSMRKLPLAELILLRDRLKAQLTNQAKADRIAAGMGNPSNIYVRFKK